MDDIVLYRIVSVHKIENFLSTENILSSVWTLTKPKGLAVAHSKAECKMDGQSYVIEYKLEDLSTKKLIKILHKELSYSETKELLSKNEWLKTIYLTWLKGKNK